MPQSRNQLKDWRSENDKISRGMYEEIKDEANKARMVKVERTSAKRKEGKI